MLMKLFGSITVHFISLILASKSSEIVLRKPLFAKCVFRKPLFLECVYFQFKQLATKFKQDCITKNKGNKSVNAI